MHTNWQKVLRVFLNILAIYLLFDAAIHLTNIRLISVTKLWSVSALSYAILMNAIYASFVFLAAALIWVVQKSLKKYQDLIFISSFWAIFHGLLLIYLSYSQNFMHNFLPFSSLYVWLPFYNQYLLFEATLSFTYAGLVFLWRKSDE